jgi:hypothetical protein
MHRLWCTVTSETRGLLRVLLLWVGSVSAGPGGRNAKDTVKFELVGKLGHSVGLPQESETNGSRTEAPAVSMKDAKFVWLPVFPAALAMVARFPHQVIT